MKLIHCHIENFGCLHQTDIDFNAGLHVICEENGWGKSTLAAFIRAMFYGLSGENRRQLTDNERKRYAPWQGGLFGGSLVFETDGRRYLITREFGDATQKKKGDFFELRDLDTNQISYDYSDPVGEKLFHVNRDSFMKTVFIDQNQCATSATDDIHVRIGHLTENDGDMNRYEAAQGQIQEALNRLTPHRVTGSIRKRSETIHELRYEIDSGKNLNDALADALSNQQRRQTEYTSAKAALQNQARIQRQVNEAQAAIGRREQWNDLQETLRICEGQLRTCRRRFPGQIPSSQEVREQIRICDSLYRAQERRDSYRLTDRQLEELESIDAPPTKSLSSYGIAALCAVSLGMLLTILLPTWRLPGIVLILAGLAILIFSFRYRDHDKTAAKKRSQELHERQRKAQEAEAECKHYQQILDTFLSDHELPSESDPADQLYTLLSCVDDYEDARRDEQAARSRLKDFTERIDTGLLSSSDAQIRASLPVQTELDDQRRRSEQLLEDSQQALQSVQSQVQDLREALDHREQCQEQLLHLQELQQAETEQYRRLKLASQGLARAKEALASRYAHPVYQNFCRYYSVLTNTPADGLHLDTDIRVTQDAHGRQRSSDAMSRGQQDLVGFCLRIALVDAMYPGDAPMLVLDDPFLNLDDEKLERAKVLLEELEKRYQILYFTCSQARS